MGQSIASKRFCAVSEAATLTSVCCVLAVLDALIRYTADLVSLDTALTSTGGQTTWDVITTLIAESNHFPM